MNAYVCVYLHQTPSRRNRRRTESAAASNPILHRFLDVYDNSNCFYDWGDDPSFFAASEIFGDVRYATWGVCRPDVRRRLKAGDYIVFFCAKSVGGPVWEYFYIGVGTACRDLTRQTIWSDDQYADYRDFFNILARSSDGMLEQHETIYPYHDDDWQERCEAPYWLFDREQSQFNLVNPLHVATYIGTEGAVENWDSSRNLQVDRLKALLFPPSAPRRHLRINNRLSHRHINLLTQLGQDADLNALRSHLMELATSSP
jgi:hypothetical protein